MQTTIKPTFSIMTKALTQDVIKKIPDIALIATFTGLTTTSSIILGYYFEKREFSFNRNIIWGTLGVYCATSILEQLKRFR